MDTDRQIAELGRALPDSVVNKRCRANIASLPESVQANMYRSLSNGDFAKALGFGSVTAPTPPPPPVPRVPRVAPTEETIARVFARVCETGGFGKSDLVRELELDASVVDGALKALVETGKIERTGAGRATMYRATNGQ